MQPGYNPGDFILVNRWAYLFSNPQKDDIVVLQDPANARRSLLKRIEKAENSRYYVLGDNRKMSRDSRKFGLVSKRAIRGKVWLHLKKDSR